MDMLRKSLLLFSILVMGSITAIDKDKLEAKIAVAEEHLAALVGNREVLNSLLDDADKKFLTFNTLKNLELQIGYFKGMLLCNPEDDIDEISKKVVANEKRLAGIEKYALAKDLDERRFVTVEAAREISAQIGYFRGLLTCHGEL